MTQILLNGINVPQLLEQIGILIEEKISKVGKVESPTNNKFFTRSEVAKLLKISLPTLHDWTKLGLLQSYKIGNRVLYKPCEVEAALTKAETFKFKKGGRNV